MKSSVIIICLILFCYESFSQNQDRSSGSQPRNVLRSIDSISSKSLKYIDDKYSRLNETVAVQSAKLLKCMQRKEAKLQKKLHGIDSSKAKELYAQTQEKYQELEAKLKAPIDKAIANPLKEYIPGVDSLQTIMKFLSQPNSSLSEIPGEKLVQIQSISSEVQQLQGRLQQANEIHDFIRNRESQLKLALANTSLGKELLRINKEVYYYQERLAEYKELLRDRKKLEEKVFATVRDLPAFQRFMQKHSYLAQLFKIPDNSAVASTEAIPGLQTRASVQNILAQRFSGAITSSGAGVDPRQYLHQQMQQASTQLNALRDKISQLGGGSSDMTMPDGFKPNSQKTKTFFQRFEYGLNIQSQRGASFLPAMSDLAFTLGYKLSDKKTIGLGASYKIGWGHGFDNIHFSSEGVALRSYADIKAKGSIWITGGLEYNYFQHFNNLSQIKNLVVWQKSALLGLEKKYKVGNRNGNIQALYDFLAARQVPQAQSLKFRIGYTF
jgi:hypothetical protein